MWYETHRRRLRMYEMGDISSHTADLHSCCPNIEISTSKGSWNNTITSCYTSYYADILFFGSVKWKAFAPFISPSYHYNQPPPTPHPASSSQPSPTHTHFVPTGSPWQRRVKYTTEIRTTCRKYGDECDISFITLTRWSSLTSVSLRPGRCILQYANTTRAVSQILHNEHLPTSRLVVRLPGKLQACWKITAIIWKQMSSLRKPAKQSIQPAASGTEMLIFLLLHCASSCNFNQ